MIHPLRSACASAVLVGALTASALVSAKPPDLPEDGTFTAKPATSPPARDVEALPMPHEDSDITCPYLRQQMINRHAGQIAAPELGHDVLDNLERLKRADELLEKAKDLARDGFFGEALFCCVEAAELCPGSPCAQRAVDTLGKIMFSGMIPEGATINTTLGYSEEATEPPTCPYSPRAGKPINEIVPKKIRSNSDDASTPPADYEFEVGIDSDGGLRMCADCSLGGNVYRFRYKQGNLTIWKTPDGGKKQPE